MTSVDGVAPQGGQTEGEAPAPTPEWGEADQETMMWFLETYDAYTATMLKLEIGQTPFISSILTQSDAYRPMAEDWRDELVDRLSKRFEFDVDAEMTKQEENWRKVSGNRVAVSPPLLRRLMPELTRKAGLSM